MNRIAVLNLTRSFPGDDYRSRGLRGMELPDDVTVDMVTGVEQMSPEQLWQRLEGVNLVVGSGGFDNVGVGERVLSPNWESKTVRNLVEVFRFAAILKLNDDPRARRLHGLLNCLTAQSLAVALCVVDEMIRAGVDLGEIDDFDQLDSAFPLERAFISQSTGFPVRQAAELQAGIRSHSLAEPHHWAVDGLGDLRMAVLHQQAVDRQALEAVSGPLRDRLHLVTHRAIWVHDEGGDVHMDALDLFEFDGLVGVQSHSDYEGEDVAGLLGLIRDNPSLVAAELPLEVAVVQQVIGTEVNRRVFERAFGRIIKSAV